MAIYGIDVYGRTKYGSRIRVDYGLDPFTATAVDRSNVLVSWTPPGGDWTDFRVLRNRSGHAVTEDDGTVIFSQVAGESAGSEVLDSVGGGWTYYTAFFRTPSGDWQRGGVTDVLVPYDYASADKLWDSIPDHYKHIRNLTAGYSQTEYRINPAIYLTNQGEVHNQQLAAFMEVLGWGLDTLRTQIDTVLDGSDTNLMHLSRLALLAEQFGHRIEQSAPAQNNRNLVRNLGLLYRKRGTLDGIRELLSLSTGADVDVYLGPNMMLSEDQSNFTNPQVDNWDVGTRYIVGDRVRYGNRYYQALQTAYGAAQAPPAWPTKTNAYWDHDVFAEPVENDSITRADTASVNTWQVLSGNTPLSSSTFIGQGAVDPVDAEIYNTNALGFRNTTGSTADVTVRSVPFYLGQTDFDRQLVIEAGVPTPPPTKHVEGTKYQRGAVVLYRGAHWEALVPTTDAPSAPDWRRVSIDDRPRLGLSFYAHGPWNGTPGQGGVTVNPHVVAFDEVGDYLFSSDTPSTAYATARYDAFQSGAPVAAKALDLGGTWEVVTGTWDLAYSDDYAAAYATSAGRTLALTSGLADAHVGVTFGSVGSRPQGLVFRYSDASNFWIATQTGLFKVVAGAAAANPASGATSWPLFQSGDRLSVQLSGNNILVSKNGVQVASAVDSFNSTATRHGIIVEA